MYFSRTYQTDYSINMISRENMETAYCFFHQKWRVYEHSRSERQKDDIEYAISSYIYDMDKELYDRISNGKNSFLLDHCNFANDMQQALSALETILTEQK